MTLARTLRRPRWAIPITIEPTPSAPPYLITASSAGIIDSPPSRPNLLVPTYLRARNFSHCSAWMTLARIDVLPSGVKRIAASRPLHPLLEEAALLDVVDVHIFEADMAAIIAPQDLDDLAHRRPLEAERAAEPDRAVERVAGEAVIFGRQILRHLALGEAERIEIGGEMAAHPIGADQHHRADRIVGRLLDLGVGLARGRRRVLRLGRDLLDRHQGRVEARIELVELGDRPVGARPARSLLAFAADAVQVQKPSSSSPGNAPAPAFHSVMPDLIRHPTVRSSTRCHGPRIKSGVTTADPPSPSKARRGSIPAQMGSATR